MTTERTLRITDEMVRSFRVEMTKSKWTNQWNSFEAIEAGLKAALGPRIERRNGERRVILTSSAEPTKAEVPTCGGGVEVSTIAVGPVPNRTDGLLSFHVGGSYVLLNLTEARQLKSRIDQAMCQTQFRAPSDRNDAGRQEASETTSVKSCKETEGVNGSAPHSAQEGCRDEFGEICRRAARYTYPRSSWMSDAEAQELYKAVEDRTKLIDMFCKSGLVAPTPSKQEQNKAPEIHVSEGMRRAALRADEDEYNDPYAAIYRAMRAQEIKEQGWDGLGPGGA